MHVPLDKMRVLTGDVMFGCDVDEMRMYLHTNIHVYTSDTSAFYLGVRTFPWQDIALKNVSPTGCFPDGMFSRQDVFSTWNDSVIF